MIYSYEYGCIANTYLNPFPKPEYNLRLNNVKDAFEEKMCSLHSKKMLEDYF